MKATLYNAHFKIDGVPWIATDFTGETNREVRRQQYLIDQYEAQKLNARLARMKRGEAPSSDVPSWAIGEYGK